MENGVSIYIESSGLFSFSGVSFKISRKILDYTKNYVSKSNIKSVFFYNFYELLHDFISGNWHKELKYDENLVDRYLKTGEVYQAAAYTVIIALLRIEQGYFNDAEVLVDKICEIGEIYDNDYARGTKYLVNTKLLLKRRRLYDALNEADTGITFLNRVHQHLYALCVSGIKANIQFLLKDIRGMENSLLQAKELELYEKKVAPFYINNLLLSQFLFDLFMLKEVTSSYDKFKIPQFRKNAYHSGNVVVKNSMKYAANKTEAFKLMGVYYWFVGKQNKAFAWWDKSIQDGELLGALPELAHTYLEVGKRLIEKKSRVRELNSIQAEEFLEKAKILFKELDLAYDLEALDKIQSQL